MSLSMLFFKVNECFCGCPLKLGSYIVAAIEIVSSLIFFALTVYICIDVQIFKGDSRRLAEWLLLTLLFVFLINILMAAIGAFGIFKGRSALTRCWIMAQVVTAVCMAITIFIISILLVKKYTVASWILAFYQILYTITKWGLTSVVHSFYETMIVYNIQGVVLSTPTTDDPEN